jgi:hypothetical protein
LISTLMCTLCRLHLTNKDVLGHALEQNVEQQTIFMNQMADSVEDLNMLMFGDEALKDERTSAQIGLNTGNLQVGFSHTVPVPNPKLTRFSTKPTVFTVKLMIMCQQNIYSTTIYTTK